jgi:hypothetical protein
MTRYVLVISLSLCCSSIFGQGKSAEKVSVLDKIPTETSYSWWVDGKSSVSCSGSSCTGVYSPAQAGVGSVQGAVLKLKRQDGTIAIAECNAKERLGADLATAMTGVTASSTYRSCRMPEAGPTSEIDAEFHLNTVKLYFQHPDSDSSGRIFSETYVVIGTLHPAPTAALASAASFERETGNRDVACGSEHAKVEVHSESTQHPMTSPDASHALVYIIQTDEFHLYVMGAFTTKYGLDGNWIGGNNKASYFFASVDPGTHHLCAEWGTTFRHYVTPVSIAKVVLQPGKSYFFRARVVFFSVSGVGERSITLEPVDAEEGRQLIANSAFSVATIK